MYPDPTTRAGFSAVRRIGDRRGASRSGKAGVHEGCLDRGADAAFLESLSPNPENPVRDLRGGRKDLGARVVPAPAGNRGIGPDRRDRVPRYAW